MTVVQISEHGDIRDFKQEGAEIEPPWTDRLQIEPKTNSINHTDIYHPRAVIRHYLTGQLKTSGR